MPIDLSKLPDKPKPASATPRLNLNALPDKGGNSTPVVARPTPASGYSGIFTGEHPFIGFGGGSDKSPMVLTPEEQNLVDSGHPSREILSRVGHDDTIIPQLKDTPDKIRNYLVDKVASSSIIPNVIKPSIASAASILSEIPRFGIDTLNSGFGLGTIASSLFKPKPVSGYKKVIDKAKQENPINIFQAPANGYTVSRGIENPAKDTILAKALEIYGDDPAKLEAAVKPPTEVTNFQRYTQADENIRAEVAAREAREKAKFLKFTEPSGQAQIPAEPFSPRMNVDSYPVNIPPGKDGPVYQTVPSNLYPRRAQTGLEALVPERLKGSPVVEAPVKPKLEPWKLPDPPEPPRVGFPADLHENVNPSPEFKTKTPYQIQGGPLNIKPEYDPSQLFVRNPVTEAAPEIVGKNLKLDNHTAFKRWSTKLQGANELGRMEKEDWSHLPQGIEAIDAYQAGDRATPGFSDVEKLMSDLYDKEVAAGFELPKKENYLRQFWKQAKDDATKIQSKVVSKIPGFAKESAHETYAEGRASGLEQRFENLNEIVAARISEHKRALANKELYDYLEKTNQLAQNLKGDPVAIRQPGRWSFTGPDSARLTRYASNVLNTGSKPTLRTVAEITGRLKNIYLMGGVPGTPLNIHGYNIARSEYRARGMKGLLDFGRGVVNPANDERTLIRLRPLIKKALDYGYTGITEGNVESELTKSLNKSAIGRAYNKVEGSLEKWFESPLFKRRLPAAKALVLEDNYNRLSKTMKPEAAMKKAVEISSDFMGGVNKSLRDKDYNQIAQVVFLAPDWAESRINLGKNTVKSLFGKEDKVYRAGAARAAGMRALTAGASTALGYKMLSNSPAGSSDLPLGETGVGKGRKGRSLQTYGTSSEEFRIPENVVAGFKQGNPGPLLDIIKNRLSTPARTVVDMTFNRDNQDRKMWGKDDFGKPISQVQAAKNMLKELSAPITHQAVQAMIDYADGTAGAEEALARALELPLSYRRPSKQSTKNLFKP
jgi:hypothetical protein